MTVDRQRVNNIRDILETEVPLDIIKYIAGKLEITQTENKKSDLIEQVLDAVNEESISVVEQVANQYRFAGRTAIDWFIREEGEGRTPISFDDLRNTLVERFSTDVFVFSRMRPTLTNEPQLIYANNNGGNIVLMFAYTGRERRILVDYQPTVFSPTYFDYVVIKPEPLTIEIRANHKMGKTLAGVVCDIFDFDINEFQRVTLDEEKVNAIVDMLDANLITARHKSLINDFDLEEVTVDPGLGDLQASEEYIERYGRSPSTRKIFTFNFEYTNGFEENVTVEVNTLTGRAWFRSAVGEEAIQYFLNRVKEL